MRRDQQLLEPEERAMTALNATDITEQVCRHWGNKRLDTKKKSHCHKD